MFYIVELYPSKFWFDYYCSLECVKELMGDQWEDAEHVNPRQAFDRTGNYGQDQTCVCCEKPIKDIPMPKGLFVRVDLEDNTSKYIRVTEPAPLLDVLQQVADDEGKGVIAFDM